MARQRKDKRRFAGRIEQLEDRRVMSADPWAGLPPPLEHHNAADEPPMVEQHAPADEVPAFHHDFDDGLPPVDQHVLGDADFWIDTSYQEDLQQYFGDVSQMLTEAHNLTGWFNVRNNYGFTGLGQTVAVIDSGIAWDHFALGGGFGANYRVVGGWDFTEENDSNPYDDGASGSHGTHVSGIIGSSHGTNTGVAPGVDLVGLRVFNDAGQGFFSWIENALRWIHTNRNAFENPITAVNLSLGVSTWNSAMIPNWANLEDEFAQLEADGIFIAVSAGNSYATYNMPGLSYPAASPYVVPVMSTDDAGNMSSFSQRLGRAIAAPGQNIVSTVPDYRGNNNGIADDFGSMGGTSMAAPYVAGASVLIRQAMQFVGRTNITQDMIYDHMMATADTFFDAATNQNYKRLNLGRAIDQLMPADDYGSTSAAAFNLGTLSGPSTTNGVIGRLTDVDCFTFTAGATGKRTFTATCGVGMTPSWQVWGATPLAGQAAGAVAFNVVAGQTYTIGLSASCMGSYSIASTLEAGFTFTDWGTVASTQVDNVNVAGERWYRVTATRAGLLTVQGDFNAAGGSVNVALYSASLQLIANGATSGGRARVDATAAAGGVYYVRVSGANSDADFKLLNLVSQSGTTVTVAGTAGTDALGLSPGATHWLSVNGVLYGFAGASANTFNFDTGGGADSLWFNGSAADETVRLRVGSMQVTAAAYSVSASNIEYVTAVGGGGAGDKANLYDGAGNDAFECWNDHAVMSGAGYRSVAEGFWQYYGYGSTGNDQSILHDTAGNDTYETRFDRATLTGAGYLAHATGFDTYDAHATAGVDLAVMYDTAGDDDFEGRADRSQMSSAGYLARAYGFDRAHGVASTGADDAVLYDGASNDWMEAWLGYVYFASTTGEFIFQTTAFDNVQVVASAGGNDTAWLHDSHRDDRFEARFGDVVMRTESGTLSNRVLGFDAVYGLADYGGVDTAVLYDDTGNDEFVGAPTYASLRAGLDGRFSYAARFESVLAYASTGVDRATLNDSAGNDVLTAWLGYAEFRDAAGSFQHKMWGFEHLTAHATAGGVDVANLFDSHLDDAFESRSTSSVMRRADGARSNTVNGFEQVRAQALYGGNDRADFYTASAADEVFGLGADLQVTGVGGYRLARGFDWVGAHVVAGGQSHVNVGAVDYVFQTFSA